MGSQRVGIWMSNNNFIIQIDGATRLTRMIKDSFIFPQFKRIILDHHCNDIWITKAKLRRQISMPKEQA